MRYNRQLRVTLLENQVWFCARDLGRLIAWPLNSRSTCKLDSDQRRTLWLESHGRCDEELMIIDILPTSPCQAPAFAGKEGDSLLRQSAQAG